MNMQRQIRNFLSVVAILIAATAFGQQVSWTGTAEPLENNEYRIILKAEIPAGYHMYDMGPYENGGPNATAISFTPSEGIEIVGEVEPLTAPHRY